MKRPLSLLGLALVLALPAHADDAATGAALDKPARIRLFGSNHHNLTLHARASEGHAAQKVDVKGSGPNSGNAIGGLFSMGSKNESVSIGMPASFNTRTLNENARFGAKPFFHETELVPGKRVLVYANFEGGRRCVLRSETGASRYRQYAPGPSLMLTPEPGLDYEVSFGTDGQGCGISARQLLSNGTTVPLRNERMRQRSSKTYKVEGHHLYTFLFRPGSVYYRVVGEDDDLTLLEDAPEQADAFEAAMREIAAKPGTQMCIALPDYGYESPLMERLSRVLKAQDDAFPAIYERIDGLRGVLQLDDHVPTTFLAAAEYCQLAGMMAFAGQSAAAEAEAAGAAATAAAAAAAAPAE